jgi:hypothetical protein
LLRLLLFPPLPYKRCPQSPLQPVPPLRPLLARRHRRSPELRRIPARVDLLPLRLSATKEPHRSLAAR